MISKLLRGQVNSYPRAENIQSIPFQDFPGGSTAYLGGATAYLGDATAYLGGATAYLVGGKMNLRIRLTSAKIRVGVEVEAELGNKKNSQNKI